MKREIKFRGKRKTDGEWLYGYYFVNRGLHFIVTDDLAPAGNTFKDYEVDPETVGQYTGLTDMKGRGVYEGDIINWLRHRIDRTGYIEEGRVEFRTEEQAFVVINKFKTQDGRESVRNILNCLTNLDVVGNIHDNPELLEL